MKLSGDVDHGAHQGGFVPGVPAASVMFARLSSYYSLLLEGRFSVH